jgi:hypothetical protein
VSYSVVFAELRLCFFSKLKLAKTALRSTSANERMSDLIQIYVERGIAESLGLDELVLEFALKPRKLQV